MLSGASFSFVLLPHYFRGDLYTPTSSSSAALGPALRTVTSVLFLLTRGAAEGVRVYAVSIVVSIALGTGEITSIAIITLLTLIYTFEGGLAAVIWTDVVQTFIYVGGTLVGLVTILHLVPGGWNSVHDVASSFHKFQVFDASLIPHFPYLDLSKPYTVWAGIIGGAFFVTASHGYGPAHRAAAARSPQPTAVGSGVTFERTRDCLLDGSLSHSRSDVVRLLPGAFCGVRKS